MDAGFSANNDSATRIYEDIADTLDCNEYCRLSSDCLRWSHNFVEEICYIFPAACFDAGNDADTNGVDGDWISGSLFSKSFPSFKELYSKMLGSYFLPKKRYYEII